MKKIILLASLFQLSSCNEFSVKEALQDNQAPEITEDGISSNEHRLFISSTSHGGNLGGRIGADNICQNLAIMAGLTREYKALLGTSDNNVTDNYIPNGGIYAFDSSNTKTLVAASLTDFISGNLASDPRWDEVNNELLNADDPGYGLKVWTGYNSVDLRIKTCADWTSLVDPDGGFIGYPKNMECKNPLDPNDFMAMMQNSKADCENLGFDWTNNTGHYTFEINNGGLVCDGVGGNASHIYCISE